MTHMRGRSLSDALSLEESDQGTVVISGVRHPEQVDHELQEGDELVGATINFNKLTKQEVIDILKRMEPYDDKIQVLTKTRRKTLSKSLESLDQIHRTPERMLNDCYNKLYNSKIKRFIRDGAEGIHAGGSAEPQSGLKVSARNDSGLPRLGVDFSLNRKHQDDEESFSGDLTKGGNHNLPPLGLSQPSVSRIQTPGVKAGNSQLSHQDIRSSAALPSIPGLDSGDIRLPDSQAPEGPHIGLNRAVVAPNKQGISGPALDVPDMDVEGLDRDLNMPKSKVSDFLGPEVSSPSGHAGQYSKEQKLLGLNLNSNYDSPDLSAASPGPRPHVDIQRLEVTAPCKPRISVSSLDLDSQSGQLDMPKFGIRDQAGTDVKTLDLGLKSPQIKGDVPNVSLLGHKGKGVDLSPKYKPPKFQMPKFNLPDVDIPDLKDFDGPDVKLQGPDLDVPSGRVSVDLNSPPGKLKFPKFKLFGTLPKKSSGGDLSAGLKTPELNLKSPKVRGDLDLDAPNLKWQAPNVKNSFDIDANSPDASLKAPRVKGGLEDPDLSGTDLKSPNWEVDGPKGKFRMPKLKLPTFKGPEIDGTLDHPDLDISPPDFKLKGPKADLPNFDMKAPKIKMPTFNEPDVIGPHVSSPSFSLKAPEAELPDSNAGGSPKAKLRLPKFKMPGFKGPELDGGLDGPDLRGETPEWNLKGPKADLSEFEIGRSPKAKLRMPKLKAPTLKGPGFEGPEMGIDSPDFNVKAPKVDLPDFDMSSSPKAKMRIPKFKMPGFKGPEPDGVLEGPDLRGDPPEWNLKGPKAELPDFDMGGSPKAKLRMPKLRMPGFKGPDLDGSLEGPDLDAPKLKMPNVGLDGLKLDAPNLPGKTPDVDLPGLNISGGINVPDLSGPKVKVPTLDRPKLGCHTPDWVLNAPSGEIKIPKFQGPDLDIKSPGVDAPHVDLPDIKLKSPNLDVKMPDVSPGSPKAKFQLPKFKKPNFSGLKGPELDGPDAEFSPKVGLPDAGVSRPSWKLRKPNFDLPDWKIGGPNMEAPDVDLDFPNMNMSNPNIREPKIDVKTPDLDVKGPNINMPSGGMNLPKLGAPDWNLKGPKLETELPNPNWQVKTPNLKTPDVDVGSPKSKFKFPKLKMPKLNLPSIKGTKVDAPDLDANLKPPKVDVKMPDIDRGVDLPSIDLKGRSLDLKQPYGELGSPKFSMPKLEMPKIGFGGMKTPDLDGSLDGPDFDVKRPNVNLKVPKADYDIPEFDVECPSGKFKKPSLNLPTFGLSDPKMEMPETRGGMGLPDVNFPQLNAKNLSLPAPKVETPTLNLPDIDAPAVKIGSPTAKLKTLKLKMPSFGVRGPDLDGDLNLKGPNVDLPDVDRPSVRLRKPNFNMPDLGLSGPKVDAPDFNLKNPDLHTGLDLGGSLPKVDAKMPKLDMTAPDFNHGKPSGKLNMPKLSGTLPKDPKAEWNSPDVNLKGPELHIDSPKTKVKIPKFKMPKVNLPGLKGPELDGKFDIHDANIRGSRPGVEMPDVKYKKNLKMPDVGFSGPKMDTPDWDYKSPKGLNMNLKAPKLDTANMESPNFRLKTPHLKTPKVPDMDVNVPGISGPDGRMNKPDINLSKPNINLSGSRMKGPAVNVKPPGYQLKLPDPKLRAPSVDLDAPGASFLSSQMNLRTADLDVDHPSVDLQNPTFKNRRSDLSGAAVRVPGLDMDSNVQSHLSLLNANARNHMDFHRSDLNIDDFTSWHHVSRARSGKVSLHQPNLGMDMRKSAGDLHVGGSTREQWAPQNALGTADGSNGYYVTVFPKQMEKQKQTNRKYNTLGGLDFHPPDMTLEVPNANDLKGSTFFFSNLI